VSLKDKSFNSHRPISNRSREMYRRIFVIAVVVLSLLRTTLPAHAGVGGVSVTKNCPAGATVSGTATGNFVTVAAVVGGALVGIANQAVTPGQPFTISVNYSPPQPVDTVVNFQVSDNAGPPNSAVSSTVVNCSTGGSGPTFYNPGDPRINGQPGDHEAVYCNPGTLRTGTLAVIPINLDSTGGPEVRFSYLMLMDNYPHEASQDLGPNGVVKVSMDLDLNFHVRLFGGPFHANGQGDNAKDGSCAFAITSPVLVGNVTPPCPVFLEGKFTGTDKVTIGLIHVVGHEASDAKIVKIPEDQAIIVCFPGQWYETRRGNWTTGGKYYKVWVNGESFYMGEETLKGSTDIFR